MGGRRWHRRRRVLAVAAGILAAAISVAAYAFDWLDRQELNLIDARFSIRGDQPAPDDILLVKIDTQTFDKLKLRWPFPRSVHGRVVDQLRKAGAKVIAYDVQFTVPTTRRQDNALIRAVKRAGNVVLATTETNGKGRTNIFGGDYVLRRIDAHPGNAILFEDADGVDRRVRYEVAGLKTLAVVIAEQAAGHPIPSADFPDDAALIDYAGPPGTIHDISFWKVATGDFPPSLVRNKIVIVGPTAPTLHDTHPTSVSGSKLMSGAELEANAVSTILRGLPLKDAGGWLNILLILVMSAIPPVANLRLPTLRSALVSLVVAGVFLVAAQLAFNSGTVIAVIYPLLALALATVGTLAASYFTATVERERVRDLFARFVPEAVVGDVLATAGEDLRLGGIERVCTVMFCDLRGFTTFSETLPADRVIEVVNVYLGEMSEAILDAGGTLLAYLGDGIMALYGAPIDQDDHADRALAAAREMMGSRLVRFNAWLREQGLGDGFRMGIGLNTGPVMAGNVGSEQRLEYTAIGDTTNTASRLEGLTKGTPHMLFVAASTKKAMTRPAADLVQVGEFDVRGREAKLEVWSVPDPQ
jgi:adenylate cyclase